MTKTITPGTIVTDSHGDTYEYGGEGERPGFETITYNMRYGGNPVICCDVDRVMPLTDMPEMNKKDARIIVANDKAGRPGSWVGPWRSQSAPEDLPRWFRTKTEAVENAARRLAIREWHNS